MRKWPPSASQRALTRKNPILPPEQWENKMPCWATSSDCGRWIVVSPTNTGPAAPLYSSEVVVALGDSTGDIAWMIHTLPQSASRQNNAFAIQIPTKWLCLLQEMLWRAGQTVLRTNDLLLKNGNSANSSEVSALSRNCPQLQKAVSTPIPLLPGPSPHHHMR